LRPSQDEVGGLAFIGSASAPQVQETESVFAGALPGRARAVEGGCRHVRTYLV